MEATEIVLTVMCGGFALMFALMLVVWNSLNKRFDKIEIRLDKSEVKLCDIDKRLTVVETILHMNGCCVLKEQNHLRKAE